MTSAQLVEAQLTGTEARALTDKIKIAVEGTWHLIEEAYTSRAWAALGYDTWDDYCTREFGTSRLRLPREERQEVVASLRESGLSARAISAATGLGLGTVQREISAGVPNGTPAKPVTGTDGKTYAVKSSPQPQAETEDSEDLPVRPLPPEKKRRPLTEAFKEVGYDLIKVVERVDRLTTDDRFPRNAEQVALCNRGDLLRALDLLTTAVDRIPVPNEKG